MRVLILGGTAEARALAAQLADDPDVEVVSSLAGRVRNPRLPVGEVRVGGFGGPDGLAEYLRAHEVDAVVDATHPFAARISGNARAASDATRVPLLVVRRPAWVAGRDDRWTVVATAEEAAAVCAGHRVLLTIGRQGVAAFADVDAWFLIRAIDPPDGPIPPRSELLLARGPFPIDGERTLIREHAIDLIVSKNSGGPLTEGKLLAARELGLPVVMIARPPLAEGVEVVDDVEAAALWVRALPARHRDRHT